MMSYETEGATFNENMPKLDCAMAKKVVFHANEKVQQQLSESQKYFNTMNLEYILRIHHSDIALGKMIGEGSFASVYEIRSRNRKKFSINNHANDHNNNNNKNNNHVNNNDGIIINDRVVVKTLRPRLLNHPGLFATCIVDINKEAAILSSLQHPNIINLKAISSAGGIDSYLTGGHDAFFMVLERFEVTLASKLEQWSESIVLDRSLHGQTIESLESYPERLHLGTQIASALMYLHSKCIVHRDVRPENIGIDKDGNAKLFDFETARMLPDSDHTSKFKLTQKVGTRRYCAPEVGLGRRYNISADVYSFSILLHYLLSLERPYDCMASEEMVELVFVGGNRPRISRRSWPQPLRALLQQAWSGDATERTTMEVVYETLIIEQDKLFDSIKFDLEEAAAATTTTTQQDQQDYYYYKEVENKEEIYDDLDVTAAPQNNNNDGKDDDMENREDVSLSSPRKGVHQQLFEGVVSGIQDGTVFVEGVVTGIQDNIFEGVTELRGTVLEGVNMGLKPFSFLPWVDNNSSSMTSPTVSKQDLHEEELNSGDL